VEKKGGKLELRVSGDQAAKAEGNNLGSYGQDPDDSKARRFIPIKGETFRKEIWDDVKSILREFADDADQ
jgi:hypothetical protein